MTGTAQACASTTTRPNCSRTDPVVAREQQDRIEAADELGDVPRGGPAAPGHAPAEPEGRDPGRERRLMRPLPHDVQRRPGGLGEGVERVVEPLFHHDPADVAEPATDPPPTPAPG